MRRSYTATTPTRALTGIDLDIAEGDFLAIEGPSGGGKSTLLNIIGLLDAPSEGRYEIAGIDTSGLSERERSHLRLTTFAFVFQSFHLLDRRPVIDSVELGLLYRRTSPADRRARALAALDQVGLGNRAFHLASTLSGGERQRVAIARAFTSRAPILIADEPTGNLDSENSGHIMSSLRELHRAGATIILVTHSAEIASQAEWRATIRDGRIVGTSPGSSASAIVSTASAPHPVRASRVRGNHAPRLRDVIHDAMASLASRNGRTAGLASALAIGVALFVGTLGVSASAAGQVSSAFDAHANRDVTVSWNTSKFADTDTREQSTVVDRLYELSGVDAVGLLTSVGETHVQASPSRQSFDVDGFAITRNTPPAARLGIRWASPAHRYVAAGEALVGAALAKKMELGPLDGAPVVLVNNIPMTVVGIVNKSPRFPELLGGITTVSSDAASEATSQKAVILTKPGAAQQVAQQAPLVIHPYDTSLLDVDAPADPSGLRVQVQRELEATLLGVTIIALVAATAGLTNSMTASVLERTHEFGLRRAVGATRRQVSSLVLTEATIIGAIGGVFGLVLGLGAILTLTLIQHWTPIFDLALAPVAVAGGLVVGAASGVLAARRAASIQPHQALRS